MVINVFTETSPYFSVDRTSDGNEREYTLTFSNANVREFLAGCPHFGRLSGVDDLGTVFDIYWAPNELFPHRFLSNNDGYFAEMGSRYPHLPLDPIHHELEVLLQKQYDTFVSDVKNSQKIPIEIRSGVRGSPEYLNVGYIQLCVDD